VAGFISKNFLPLSLYHKITEIRVADPDRSIRTAKKRKRRPELTRDGRLNILAIDHPARRSNAVGSESMRMADRHDLLSRIVRVLACRQVDGIMASMDILEDLFIIDSLLQEKNGRGILQDKLVMASLNRGGLANTAWEMDDPMTGPTPASCKQWNFDGAKILLRIHDEDPASLKTLLAGTKAITEMNALGLPTFLEPLPVVKKDGKYPVVKDADKLAAIIGVASALGDSSRYLWLKLPYCDHYEKVAGSTTLPILLLGGDSTGDDKALLNLISRGMAAGPNVRGAMMGRNVLFPPNDRDPYSVAEAVGGLIHKNWPVDQAYEMQKQQTLIEIEY
jgi:DhnA family fructose-bisphosphate aldolase class Ia